jgi:hypothetical protein
VHQGALRHLRDDRYLVAVDACREEARGTRIHRAPDTGALRIHDDARSFDACVARRLRGIEVEVLPASAEGVHTPAIRDR